MKNKMSEFSVVLLGSLAFFAAYIELGLGIAFVIGLIYLGVTALLLEILTVLKELLEEIREE